MIVHQHDTENYYVCPCDDHGGPMPHNCVKLAPPARPWVKSWYQWTGKKWQKVEDHRERRTDGGFLPEDVQGPTDYWLPSAGDTYQSSPRHMTAIGPLPAGAVLERPEKPASIVAEEQERALQGQLDEIDRKSARPLRALAAGTATDEDRATLAELETQAAALRGQVRTFAA